MKRAEIQKLKVEHTLKVLENMLRETDEQINKDTEELETLQSILPREQLVNIHSYSRLTTQIAKDEHMKFHLKKEIDKLDKIHLQLLIAVDEINQKS